MKAVYVGNVGIILSNTPITSQSSSPEFLKHAHLSNVKLKRLNKITIGEKHPDGVENNFIYDPLQLVLTEMGVKITTTI